MNQFLSCFKVMKPVIGVIHTKGTDDADMLRRAKEEIRIKQAADGHLPAL